MKKRHVALAVGLALTMSVGAISLAACDEPATEPGPFEDDNKFAAVATTETTHFLAGELSFYGGGCWGTSDNLPNNAALRFKQHTEKDNLYKISVNLIEGDRFKIRYEGEGWGDGASHSNIPANYLIAEQKDLTEADIIAVDDTGGKAFKVTKTAKYEIWLTMNELNGEPKSVQWVNKGAADQPAAVTSDVRVKGAYNNWGDTTLCLSGLKEDGSLSGTFKLKYTGVAAEFGLYTTKTGEDNQIKWIANELELPEGLTGITKADGKWYISEGVYEITVTVDRIAKFTAVTITEGATEDAETIVIPPVAPPPAAE